MSPKLLFPYPIATLVFVTSRTTPGINKPGGVGHVVDYNSATRTYSVRYVLTNSIEKDIAVQYVTEHEYLEGRRSRRDTTPPKPAKPAAPSLTPRMRKSKSPQEEEPESSQLAATKRVVLAEPPVVTIRSEPASLQGPPLDESRFAVFSQLLAQEMKGRDRLSVETVRDKLTSRFPSAEEQQAHLRRLDKDNRIMLTHDSVWAV